MLTTFYKIVVIISLLLIAAAMPVYAAHDCSDPNYVRSFDERLDGHTCTEVTRIPIRWSGGVAHFRVLATDDVRGRRSNIVVSWISQAASRIGAAMDQMGGLRLDDPTIMISNLPMPLIGDVRAWALIQGRQPYKGQCLGIAYEFDDTYDADAARQILAHETFHCIQRATWPGSLEVAERGWWVEGSAEYFANFAVPGTRLRGRFVPTFQSHALSTSLLDMAYENEVFFSWLGEHHGVRGVKSFLDAVSPGRDRAAYRANAEAALSPGDWKDFAIAAASDSIYEPDSTVGVGLDQSAIPLRDLGNGETHLTADALVILVVALNPAPPGLHQLHTIATPRPYGATKNLNNSSGWAEMPESMDVPCQEQLRIYLAAMTATQRGQDIRIQDNVQRHVCKERPGPGPTSSSGSIVGTWEMTAESLQRDIKLIVARTDRCTIVSGSFRMTFNPNGAGRAPGSGLFTFDRITFRCEPPASSGTDWFVRTIDGTSHIRWYTNAGVLILSFADLARQVGTIRTEMHYRIAPYQTPNPETKEGPLMSGIGLGPFLGGRYRISGDTLHVGSPPGHPPDENYSFDFIRVGAPTQRR